MIKLHEIPIYALSKKELSKRYKRFKEKFWEESPPIDQETFDKCMEIAAFPQRCWEHNHIVGYIDILLDKHDIVFEVYLPYPEVVRYNWRSRRKALVYNICANGTHFFVDLSMSNYDIQTKISDMLDFVVTCHIPSRFVVNRTAFNAVYRYTDYKSIIDAERNNGEIL